MKLLSVSADAKTIKGEEQGFLTGILYLAPADISGYEVCPKRSAGCTKACLYKAGRGAFSNVQLARIAKTKFYFENRSAFMEQLVKEIIALVAKAKRKGLTPVVRLNGTSDIPWERVPVDFCGVEAYNNIMELFPDIQFYDYTKRANRKDLPANYHLTFSMAEDNEADAKVALENGMNVTVVFRNENFPVFYLNKVVVSGDDTDLRFLDPKGVIVGLKAKGPAKKDTTGFVKEAVNV